MAFDLVYAFVQFNCITSLSNAHDVCCFLLSDEEQGLGLGLGPGAGAGLSQALEPGRGSGSLGPSGPVRLLQERDVMSQVSDALGVLSDVDLLLARKYDPSSLLDRSDTSCFPEVRNQRRMA